MTILYLKGNKTCRRFKAIVDESVTIEPPRHADLVATIGVFEYIGTKNEEGKGDVFLSTNTNVDGDPCLVYNWDNDQGSELGWILSLRWLQVSEYYVYLSKDILNFKT